VEAPSIPSEAASDAWRTSAGLDTEACKKPHRRAAAIESMRPLIHVEALLYLRGGATTGRTPLLEHDNPLSGASRNRGGCETGESTADYGDIVTL
jgi:hypothetical protein